MVLRRSGQADLPIFAKRLMKARSSGSDEISNSMTATDLVIKMGDGEIAAAEWPGPPVDGDIVALADDSYEWSVNKVDTRRSAGVTVMHFLYVEGAG